ncbi:hypothetical protein FHG64_10170 [Antarcticibacterium flavum]|uniref:Uncharacterized protein n=1 Tax=Antarcticibacterium flavum TaxID=2058175 RepID=A0A5B7X2F7_9FLAO|nr:MULTISPECIES: hypothetical protein [Antarcticibacterium]QCY69734.1 hypothetical protein FHG64_10170 [Antarcticibacterium flavum]
MFIYLLLAIISIGNSNSFALSPAAPLQVEQETLQEDSHNLPLFSEEIAGTFIFQVVTAKPFGNQGLLSAFTTPAHSKQVYLDPLCLSVYPEIQKALIKRHTFPFHFFW